MARSCMHVAIERAVFVAADICHNMEIRRLLFIDISVVIVAVRLFGRLSWRLCCHLCKLCEFLSLLCELKHESVTVVVPPLPTPTMMLWCI